MGRVIIKYKDGHSESSKCKSEARAAQVAGKRNNVKEWKYFDINERISTPKKKKIETRPMTLEEVELRMKMQGLM